MLKQISLLFFCVVSLLEVSFVGKDSDNLPSDSQRERTERSIASVTDLRTKVRENEMAVLKKIEITDVPLDAGEEIVVAVFDTGIDLTDVDLTSKIYRKNGQMIYKDFTRDESNSSIHDLQGHGTNIAKIITTINPKARILPVRLHDGFKSGLNSYTKAIEWLVVKHPEVKLVNISMSGDVQDEDEYYAFMTAKALGVTFVIAAGNDGFDISEYAAFPAGYSLNGEFIVVGATRDDRTPSEKGNYSNKIVDFTAQGERFGFYSGSQYKYLSGTSQSAAVISGIVSQILSHRKGEDLTSIKSTLQKYSSNNSRYASKHGNISYRPLLLDLNNNKEKFRNIATR